MDRSPSYSKKVKRVASIDIGTNTILMIIADVDQDCRVNVLSDYQEFARLGENLSQTGLISQKAIERAIDILRKYKNEISKFQVEKVFTVATSAMRRAKNSKKVKKLFEEVLGSKISIIDGDTEAIVTYLGSIEDSSYSVALDIGGGSTEIITGENGEVLFKKSLNIGVVSLAEEYLQDNSIPRFKDKFQLQKQIESYFSFVNSSYIKGKIYAIGGTATTLAMCALGLKNYNSRLVNNYFLDLKTIQNLLEQFENLTTMQIVTNFNINPMRADVILTGTMILWVFCKYFGLNGVKVSDKGVRYGVISHLFCKEFNKTRALVE